MPRSEVISTVLIAGLRTRRYIELDFIGLQCINVLLTGQQQRSPTIHIHVSFAHPTQFTSLRSICTRLSSRFSTSEAKIVTRRLADGSSSVTEEGV